MGLQDYQAASPVDCQVINLNRLPSHWPKFQVHLSTQEGY